DYYCSTYTSSRIFLF
nr:immunoglobulin light chain junction region [Macaca mulatta]MOY05606.1 immunoglobulin light chain junction region [Macaca mulatta]MOY06234.1 immunoglobulin light chain junction region [Macaca mulatta]MOY07174.1 immunoglobulin light chain junction region [Macaca mulatta]MOY07565.1 immunoglobulin light chain junction region [Macaca mulatta]